MGKWIFGGLFAGVALLFIGIGTAMVVRQDRAIRNAVPIRAEIIESRVTTESYRRDGKTRTRDKALIRYRWFQGDTAREADTIFPGGSMQTGSSARALVERFPAGASVQAFRDRHDPEQTFLIRAHDFGPYLFILFPMIHLSIGLLVAGSLADGGREKRKPEFRAGGMFELPAATPTSKKFAYAAGMAALWYGVGAAACGHFFTRAEPPFPTFAIVATAIYAAIGLVPLLTAVHYWRLKRGIADAVVMVSAAPVTRGQPFGVRVGVPVLSGGRIDAARVALVCRATTVTRSGGKSSTSTTDRWTDEQTLAEPQETAGEKTLRGDFTFTAPAEHPPSSSHGDRSYPRYQWLIRIRITRPGPDYRADFPVEVI